MVKDLCCVDVLQTKAATRKKMNYTHKHAQQMQMITQRHADNKENNNRSFTILFFDFSLRDQSIDRPKLASMYTFIRIQVFFLEKRTDYSIVR
jgi:hypothetical protein